MTILSKVALNTLFLSTARIVNPLTSVLLVSAVARIQGATGLGEYSLVLTMFYMAVELAGLGLSTPITRSVAVNRERASDFFIVTGMLGLVFGLLAIGCVNLLVIVLNYPEEIGASTNLLMWAVVPSVVILHCDAIFIAYHKASYIAGVSILENVCKVTAGVTLLAMGKGIFELFIAIVCLRLLVFAAYLILFRIAISPIVLRFDWTVVSELRKVSPVFTANLLLSALFGRIDILLLSKLGTMADVGYYSAAMRIIEILRLLPFSLKRAALPAMCETFYKAPDACKQLFDRCTNHMVVFGVGAALGIIVLAKLMIVVVFGEGFGGAETILQILAIYMVPASVTPVLACLLFASNLERLDLIGNIVRIATLGLICIGAIPIWSGTGAAVAVVTSEVILLIIFLAFVRAKIFQVSLHRKLGWPIVGALLGYAATLPIAISANVNRGIAAMSVYLAVIFVFDHSLRAEMVNSAHAFIGSARQALTKILRTNQF